MTMPKKAYVFHSEDLIEESGWGLTGILSKVREYKNKKIGWGEFGFRLENRFDYPEDGMKIVLTMIRPETNEEFDLRVINYEANKIKYEARKSKREARKRVP